MSHHAYPSPAHNPKHPLRPSRIIVIPSIVPITGTVAYTNTDDTSAAAGGHGPSGTVAYTNNADTSAASGTVTILGTVATTNTADTSAASGGHGPSGTSNTTNTADTTAASGGHGPSGTLATTNTNDTSTASGGHGPSGTVAYTNNADTSAASGEVGDGTITGTVAYTNTDDTSAASGSGGAGSPDEGHPGYSGLAPRRRHQTLRPDTKPKIHPKPKPPTPIFGRATPHNKPDTCTAIGAFDPFDLLLDDEELLVLV